MNKSKVLLILTVLVLSISMLACAFGGGNNNGNEAPAAQENAAEQPVQEDAAEEPAEEAAPAEAESSVDTDFPVLSDAQNLMESNGTIIYQSNASLQEAFDFYQAELSATGLTENEILTMNEDTMFQLVYTGTDDGRSLVVQTIQLDDTTINVTVRYE